MKTAYVRPMLYAEEFTLADHIASCVNVVHFGPDCGPYNINGETLFATTCGTASDQFWRDNDLEPSTVTFESMEERNLQCYTTLITLSTIFTS